MRVIDPRDESGFTMLATTIAMTVVALLAIVAVTAVNGDTGLTRRDLEQKRAYEAAKAGVNDYAYHLTANSRYWAECVGVDKPNAVNQIDKTENKLSVPGDTGATYAIELLPAGDHKECDSSSPEAAVNSMLEKDGLSNSFRIRSNGYAGQAKASIVATFRPPSFLDYVYYTHRETRDPAAYGFEPTSDAYKAAAAQCELSYAQGRQNRPFWNGERCETISFATGDQIRGPMRSDDAISIDGSPIFGRGPQDAVKLTPEPGYYGNSAAPIFLGPYEPGQPEFTPPESNEQLQSIAFPQFHFTGQVKICLSGKSMSVGSGSSCTGLYSGPIPSNGVVWIGESGCNDTYSPKTVEYKSASNCAYAYVEGKYEGQLTIASQNSIIIDGSLERTNSTGMLGLIANNFIRYYHPCDKDGVGNEPGSMESPTIDAAMLALQHSIIVDHFDCGKALGTLNVEGALAQKFRGTVGQGVAGPGGHGYLKNYVYDDRLRFQEPPYFIQPKTESWIIGRETLG